MNAEVKPGYKLTEVGIIPEDWDVKKLRNISPSQTVGLVINPSSYFDDSGMIPMLVGSTVSENSIAWENANRITESSNLQIPASRVFAGDLVMVRVGEPGVTAIIPPEIDGCNCASMMIIRRSPSFDSRWLCFLMNSDFGRSQVAHVQYGTAQKQFNISDAIDFIYPVPLLQEQRAIAAALSDMDALISGLDQLITKKRDIKQASMQQLLTGQKRLPGFSGEWSFKRLADICYVYSGGTPSTSNSEYYAGSIPWITSGDLNKHYITEVSGRISERGLSNSAAKIVDADTLLIALYGATAGVTAISKIKAAINQAVLAIIPVWGDVNFLYFKLSYLKDWIIKTYTQGGQPNLSGGIVKSIEMSFPIMEEQTAIASTLSDMDTELAALETRRDKALQLKQAMMQELLTGRIRFV